MARRDPLAGPLMRTRRARVGLELTNQEPELPVIEYQHVVEQLAPEAAMHIMRWRYLPCFMNGRPVPICGTKEFNEKPR
jgi:hypothetical protein